MLRYRYKAIYYCYIIQTFQLLHFHQNFIAGMVENNIHSSITQQNLRD